MKNLGIIAGAGELPKIIARDARDRGFRVITIALEEIASPDLAELSYEIKWINIGKLGLLIDTLKKNSVDKVIMAGKVSKTILYRSKIVPDLRAAKLLFSLRDRSDDTILKALRDELDKEGITIIDTTAFSPHLLTPVGVLTKDSPSKDEWKDIEFGWNIAKEIGKLDIGQTVVVKDLAVIAIEAIEGTDEAIIRGGRLAGEGVVVVKVSKPHQDMRLDVPVVGMQTIQSMINVSARILALEANRSIILNRDKVIREAEEAGITILGVNQ